MELLLVEDDGEVADALSDFLSAEKHVVTTTNDAEHAVGLLEQREFDLVLSDICLPGHDGLWLLREMRRRWPETDMVLVTAYGSIAQAVAAIRERAVDYLAKPI